MILYANLVYQILIMQGLIWAVNFKILESKHLKLALCPFCVFLCCVDTECKPCQLVKLALPTTILPCAGITLAGRFYIAVKSKSGLHIFVLHLQCVDNCQVPRFGTVCVLKEENWVIKFHSWLSSCLQHDAIWFGFLCKWISLYYKFNVWVNLILNIILWD
jgi:hypothetical protein